MDIVTTLRALQGGRVYQLEDMRYEGRPRRWLTIGASENCDVVVDAGAEEFHCLLLRENGRVYVRDDKHDGTTLVNGIPVVSGLVALHPGNLLTVGRTTLLACGTLGARQDIRMHTAEQKRRIVELWSPTGAPSGSARDAHARTTVRTRTCTRDRDHVGETAYYLLALADGTLLELGGLLDLDRPNRAVALGRDAACAIVLEDANVSHEHCYLRYLDGEWWVQDGGSKNGSYLDGLRLPPHSPVPLYAGSALTLGKTVFLVCGHRGAEQNARLAPVASEYARRAVSVYGSQARASKRVEVPRQTLQGWLKKRRGKGRI